MPSDFLVDLFSLNAFTVIKILVWGNFLSGLFVFVFVFGGGVQGQQSAYLNFGGAKFAQSVGWILFLLMGRVPFLLSANFGVTCLLVGCYVESRSLLFAIKKMSVSFKVAYGIVFGVILIYFNFFLAFFPSRDFNIFANVLATITFLFCVPGFACLLSRKKSPLRYLIGFAYLTLLIFPLLRLFEEVLGFSFLQVPKTVVESAVFLTFLLILFVGSAGFMLIVKETNDRHILELAYLDHLTGLLNRRHFLEDGAIGFDRHLRYGASLSILFLDVDYFKKVNDRFGHAFGDEVLRDFGRILRRTVRGCDLACRWGGEEFVILLTDTTVEGARALATRIRSEVALSSFPKHLGFSYTLSIGIHAGVPNPGFGATLDSFIEKADMAMYRAKENGRDRVELYA